MAKAESLLRWHHPQLGLIGPADFIPLAEETGLIIEIGDWVFRQTASYAAGLQRATPLQLSIRLSALQFQSDSHQIEEWLALLAQLDLAGQSLNIEITECLLLNAVTHVTAKLLSFRDAGIQVSLDDFGTGYSALSYLKRYDIDYLKIDPSFIQNLESDSNDLVLSEAIVIMAHKLGLKVIAEGVETEAQRQLLLSIGCDYGQGYLFSRPLPASKFEQLIARTAQGNELW
ncbi:EAL domain-containing protein [Marinobacter changyiensis]|uniref:EAL domain-containing protein n=1 Tax=Marinobacter changyiensis TaxID=2604091 RepID=UPI001FE85B68|nr:EAL domain-containing protein [Marinobacter changyiensis]